MCIRDRSNISSIEPVSSFENIITSADDAQVVVSAIYSYHKEASTYQADLTGSLITITDQSFFYAESNVISGNVVIDRITGFRLAPLVGGTEMHPHYQEGYLGQTNQFESATMFGDIATPPSARVHVQCYSDTTIGQIVQGYASQTEDLSQWWDDQSGVLAIVNASGYVYGTGIGVLNEYTMPIVDGSDYEILVTDGTGTVSWDDNLADELFLMGG